MNRDSGGRTASVVIADDLPLSRGEARRVDFIASLLKFFA
jgi:hypothetical protein